MVIAESQSAGRGRLGRSWASPDRLGLYVSLLLRPAEPPEQLGRYALAGAVAVTEASRSFAGDRVVLKWPNDVMADGRKLAGILAELRQGPSGAELVLGVGLNVDQREEDFPDELAGQATSLRLLRDTADLDREGVAAELLRSLAGVFEQLRTEGWPGVAARFLRYAPDATGRRVRVLSGAAGVTCGLDASGALRIETAGGIVLAHASESVTLLEE